MLFHSRRALPCPERKPRADAAAKDIPVSVPVRGRGDAPAGMFLLPAGDRATIRHRSSHEYPTIQNHAAQ